MANAAVVAVIVAGLGGCGGEAGDLLAIEVAGGFGDERVRLTVTGDGRGSCDQGPLEPISSELLIDAREVEREMGPLAEEGARFGPAEAAGGSARDRRYVALTRAGVVRWVEGAPGLPGVLPQAALLAQELQEELCDR